MTSVVPGPYQPESFTGNTPFAGVPIKSPFGERNQGSSVNVANGEFVARMPILEIDNSIGAPFSFDLTHRSIGNPEGNPALGWSWDANWLQSLERSGDNFLHHTGTGRTDTYTFTAGGGYDGPPGSYTRLAIIEGKLHLIDRDGNHRVFRRLNDMGSALSENFDSDTVGGAPSGPGYTFSMGGGSGGGGVARVTANAGAASSAPNALEVRGNAGYDAPYSAAFATAPATDVCSQGLEFTVKIEVVDVGTETIVSIASGNRNFRVVFYSTTSTDNRMHYTTTGGLNTVLLDGTWDLSATEHRSFRLTCTDTIGTITRLSDGVTASVNALAGAGSSAEMTHFALQGTRNIAHYFDDVQVGGGSYRLERTIDAAGNQWNLTYDSDNGTLESISDPQGRHVTFQYATNAEMAGNPFHAQYETPLLKQVTDFTGRTAQIEYDHSSGKIVGLKTPGGTGGHFATAIDYDSAHRIVGIDDNEGQTYLSIDYDSFGRVQSQLDGTGGMHSFTYGEGATRIKDPNANEVDWKFLHGTALRTVPSSKVEYTRQLRADDPPSFTTAFTFNAQDEPLSVTFPKGNKVEYQYDEAGSFQSRGNLLLETRSTGNVRTLRDEANHQASIVTQYEYDPTYNVVTKIIDPRGTNPYSPPNGGTATAARYTTRIYYDFEEAALGDLNGDGVTTSKDRKPVKVVHSTVNPAGVPHAAFTSVYANQAVVEKYKWNSAGQLLEYSNPAGVKETRTYYSSGPSKGNLQGVTADAGGLGLITSYEYDALGHVTNLTDPEGHVRRYEVDARGRATQMIGPAPTSYRSKATYDDNDNLVSLERETDAATNAYTLREFAYDELDRLTAETTHAARSTEIQAAILGQGTPPPTTLTVQYDYDGNGNLVERTGSAGGVEQWTYDERNFPLTQSGPDGGAYAYDGNGNLASHQDPLGHTTLYQYDGYERTAARIDALGNVFVQNYDPAGNVVRERGFQGGPFGQILYARRYFHDEANQAYRVDAWHNPPTGTSKASTTGTLSPGDNWVTSLQQRDSRGFVTRVINDNVHVTSMEYDNAGRLKKTTDPLGNEVSSTYDANGNAVTTTQKDAGGTGGCPQVCVTTLGYDAENRLSQVTNPDTTTKTFTYDGRSNLVKTIDEAGNEVRTFYDDADRPWLVRHKLDASTNVDTTTHWDAENRAMRKCDDADACTAYSYVPGTQLVAAETPAIGPSMANTYDAAGNVKTASYSSGKTVNFGYDPLNQRITVDVGGVPPASGTTRQRFTYDGLGQVTQATDNGVANLGGGVATGLAQVPSVQRFDTLGRVVLESQLGLPVMHTLDGVGNVHSTKYPSPDGRVVSRSFDANERLDRVWDSKGLVVDYAYQGARVSGKDFGGPTPSVPATGTTAPTTKTVVTYDDAQHPTSVQHKNAAGTILAGLTTRYDDAGNRVAQKLQGNTAGPATDPFSQLFGPDALYRTLSWKQGPIDATLTSISGTPATWSVDGQNDWTARDSGSNPCTRTESATGVPATPRQLVETCTSPASTTTYKWDANGNLQTDGTFTYRWDFLNRLIRVDDASGNLVVGYGYDAFNRRVVKVFPDNVAGSGAQAPREGWYTFAGQHIIQESQPIGSVVPLTVPLTPPGIHVIRQWVYGPNVDEALAMDVDKAGSPTNGPDGQSAIGAADKRYFYAHDSAGNVLGLFDQTGHLAEGYVYQAYGDPTIRVPCPGAPDPCGPVSLDVKFDGTDKVSTGTYGSVTGKPFSPSGNIWFFTGRQYDPEIGSYNYRARQYHPTLGQFMSMDPIGAWGDEHNLGNAYAYVGNNPSTFRDPSGMYAGVDDAIACGGGALVAAGIRGGMDLWRGKASSWQSYSGEVVGGCAGGVATLYTGPIGGGAAYGAVSSSTRYGLEVASGDRDGSWGQYGKTAGMETVTGAAGGAVAFGAGKVVQAGLRQGTPAMQQIGAGMERGLHPVKGPFAGLGRPDIAPRIARVVPTHYLDDGVTHLGPESSSDVFVTGAKNIAPFQKSSQVAKRLSLLDSSGRYYGRPLTVIEFDAPAGVAVPILRSHPGFVGYGRTAGGLPEFTAPNLALSELSNPHYRRLP